MCTGGNKTQKFTCGAQTFQHEPPEIIFNQFQLGTFLTCRSMSHVKFDYQNHDDPGFFTGAQSPFVLHILGCFRSRSFKIILNISVYW